MNNFNTVISIAKCIGFLCAIWFLIFCVRSCSNIQLASGQKIGMLVKVAQQGLFNETWECELIRGGMNSSSGAFGIKPFDFTIKKKELIDKAIFAMENQKEIIVKYHEDIAAPFTSGSQGYFADDIIIK